jgi:WD40 repeat protein
MEFAQKSDFLLMGSAAGTDKAEVLDLEPLFQAAAKTAERRIRSTELERYSKTVKMMDAQPVRAFSPDGKWIATSSGTLKDGVVYVWPVGGGKPKIFKGHRYYILSMAFSPDSRWLATGSRDRTVRLWSLENNQFQETKFLNPVEAISFSPSGTRLAAATGPAIKIWFTAIGQPETLLGETVDVAELNSRH